MQTNREIGPGKLLVHGIKRPEFFSLDVVAADVSPLK